MTGLAVTACEINTSLPPEAEKNLKRGDLNRLQITTKRHDMNYVIASKAAEEQCDVTTNEGEPLSVTLSIYSGEFQSEEDAYNRLNKDDHFHPESHVVIAIPELGLVRENANEP